MSLGGGGYGEVRLHHYTPAWATEQDSISKKKREGKKKKVNQIEKVHFGRPRREDRLKSGI